MLMAYWYTGQERYVEGMKQYILDWVRQNPKETFGSLMTRTIDTGIRCASWTPLLLHLLAMERIKEEELFEILESMEQQFLYLYQSYVPKYRQSNGVFYRRLPFCRMRHGLENVSVWKR